MPQKHSNSELSIVSISEEDREAILKIYDADKNGVILGEELQKIVKDYNEKIIKDPKILEILKKYDKNNDGVIDAHEMKHLEFSLNESTARYAGYTVGLSRLFRYLAFTSDFGEALRPVVSARIVTGTYAIAFGYCIADVGIEAYKLHNRGYITEKNQPMTLTQCVVERSAFQAVASIIVPFVIIHTTVDVTKRICYKIGRFKKWGPSVIGLSIIPLLPMYLDAPVEHAIEWSFERYGPWAHHSDKGDNSKDHKD